MQVAPAARSRSMHSMHRLAAAPLAPSQPDAILVAQRRAALCARVPLTLTSCETGAFTPPLKDHVWQATAMVCRSSSYAAPSAQWSEPEFPPIDTLSPDSKLVESAPTICMQGRLGSDIEVCCWVAGCVDARR